MEKIKSFTIDHLSLKTGLYVSRKDKSGDCVVTTFDLRICRPNVEPVIDMPALHTIEHLGATFLRNSARKDEILYFGPMGCRTGFYLLMFGDMNSQDVLPFIIELCDFIIEFDGAIPGASAAECGNWQEQNLEMAKYYIKKYKTSLICEKNLEYNV